MRVYIAAPYTQGDVGENIRNAVEAADILLNEGHMPYVPHLNHLWHLISPHDYETWLRLDMAYLVQCDVLIRLPGLSPGADREVTLAHKKDIPVFHSVEKFLLDFEGK